MKKILIILFLFATPAYGFDACKPEGYTPIAGRITYGLLYKVEKCGIKPNYVFGTMHSDSPRIEKELLGPVYKKITISTSSNFEIEETPNQTLEVMQAMYYPPELTRNLKTEIGDALYAKFQNIMEYNFPGIPELSYMRMYPWAAAIMMQYPPQEADGIVTDMRLQKFARENGIPVAGIETASEQLAIFMRLDMKTQIEFLRDSIDQFPDIQKQSDELMELYMTQNLKGMQNVADKLISDTTNERLKSLLQEELINKRNEVMARRLERKMVTGSTFVAVGALHLPGEKGLLSLLEAQGYYIFPEQ